MKLPKTFIPENGLEEKTKQLLKESKKSKNKSEKGKGLYEELKKEFPNFIDYLSGLYPNLAFTKNPNTKTVDASDKIHFTRVSFYESLHNKRVATIHPYTDAKKNMSEYGYEAQALVKGKWCNLKYRKGYHYLTLALTPAKVEDPFRIDEHKEIPFP